MLLELIGFITIVSILMIIGLEWEHEFLSGMILIGAVALFCWWTATIPTWAWIVANWVSIAECAVGYLVVGVVWGIVKWWFFLHNKADEYELNRKKWLQAYTAYKTNGTLDKPADKTFAVWLETAGYGGSYPPSPMNNKGRIMSWMWYWPWSALWTLVNDPIRRFYRFVYNRLTSLYTRMSNAVFAGRFEEFKT